LNNFGEVKEFVNLKNYNTYKIGGKARYVIKPYSIDDLKDLINYLKNNNVKYFILGKGSNVISPDEDYEGTIIILDYLNEIKVNGTNVEVSSGCILSKFINDIVNLGLGGLENLYGIPGTVGGAIYGNVGCYGSVISEYLESVTYLEDNEIKTLNKNECDFKYRSSLFKNNKNKIILKASFKLFKSNREDMLKRIKENMLKRKNSQPLEYPNAGSVFRNPENVAAGKLIEDIGLKKYNVNDAYISEKHANFIINKGNAKSEDIIKLIEFVREKIKENYEIELILEQEIVKY